MDQLPMQFDDLFRQATGQSPFPFQTRFATQARIPTLVNIPTGLGKTAMAVLGWLWRRRYASGEIRQETPRRLVYCLPMRVLVEQTYDVTRQWLRRLDSLGEPGEGKVSVHLLMGGDIDRDWDTYPDADAILIGTQDQLLSRGLNRGYATSRYRWPVQFGLLHNDSLWLFDEVQLMGAGVTTTAQLQAFRSILGTVGRTESVWMSATLEPTWLETADFAPMQKALKRLQLDPSDEKTTGIRKRNQATKLLVRTSAPMGNLRLLAGEVAEAHEPGDKTLVVLNTVRRARDLYRALKKHTKAKVLLAHSHFRQPDRKRITKEMLAAPNDQGLIIVATQVVEAGMDLSAKELFTELAPWASLVQRFGRCNRQGEFPNGCVHWIDWPEEETQQEKLAPPYDRPSLEQARAVLGRCTDVAPARLPKIDMPLAVGPTLRRKDILELFDTTPDLAGYDLDVSRFIRETSDHNLQVFWRDVGDAGPTDDEPAPHQAELCSAPVWEIRDLLKRKKLVAWVWDPLEGTWSRLDDRQVLPGTRLLLRAADGNYTEEEGWSLDAGTPVPVIAVARQDAQSYSMDSMSETTWMSLTEHTDQVVEMATRLVDSIPLPEPWRHWVIEAARWHDAGKAHPEFQYSLRGNDSNDAPPGLLAKSARKGIRHRRPGLRHELASGVLAIMHGKEDLVAYLAASHHGKVRLSLRSLPIEHIPPGEDKRFARGIWEGDEIPEIDLGGGVKVPSTVIDLSLMDLGDGPRGPSWSARMLALRDREDLGPFRLAYLEALVKIADERASRGE